MAAANGGSEGGAVGGPLDCAAFPAFAQLLRAAQDYAALSGCRFRGSDFFHVDPAAVPDALAEGAPARSMAKLRAVAAVHALKRRLQIGEAAVLEDLDRAFQAVVAESVRNGMVASLRELELWPPLSPPQDVGPEDSRWEDLAAPVPCIAQRLFNDETRRAREGRLAADTRRATTASFIVDFSYEAGATLPSPSGPHQDMLREFEMRAEEYSRGLVLARQADTEAGNLNPATALNVIKDNWRPLAFSAASAAVFGVAGVAATVGATLATRAASPRRRPREGRCAEEEAVGSGAQC